MGKAIFTSEQHAWIKKNYKDISRQELTDAFNKNYPESLKTQSQINSFVHNHKINSGRTGQFKKGQKSWNSGKKGWQAGGNAIKTQFKKGNKPANHKPVGSERVSADGYLQREVAEPSKWEEVHKIVWREHHGEIPKDRIIRFLDGNSLNCDIKNLVLVDRVAHALLNCRHDKKLLDYELDVRKEVVAVANLKSKLHELKNTN